MLYYLPEAIQILDEKIAFSIELIRKHEPEAGYHLAFSGGKDSIVVYDLAKRAGVKFTAYTYVAGNEPPEIYRFIRENYPDVKFLYSKYSFTKLIRMKGFLPTMKYRYCCYYIKESWGHGEYVLTGVRRDESIRRRDYDYIMKPNKGAKRILVNPILDWTEEDVWNYIHQNNLPYPDLYEKGWKRIGCVFCPFMKRAEHDRMRKLYPQLWKGICTAVKDAFEKKPHPLFGKDWELYCEWWTTQKSAEEFLQEKRNMNLF